MNDSGFPTSHTHTAQIHQENTKFPIMSSQFYEKYSNI